MPRCKIPEFCEPYKLDIGIYDPKSKRILPRTVKQRDICVHIHKKHYCVVWKKIEKIFFNEAEKIDKNFEYVKNIMNESNLKQRIRYRFPKHETIDQLENLFVFDLETLNYQEVAEAYAAGLHDVYRLRDRCNIGLTSEESVIERKKVTVFDSSSGNRVKNLLKYISEKYDGDERT